MVSNIPKNKVFMCRKKPGIEGFGYIRGEVIKATSFENSSTQCTRFTWAWSHGNAQLSFLFISSIDLSKASCVMAHSTSQSKEQSSTFLKTLRKVSSKWLKQNSCGLLGNKRSTASSKPERK